MYDYALILSKNYVGKQWTLAGDFYEGLIWLDESPKPTQVELESLWESTLNQVNQEKAQSEATKASALDKLSKLGLTADEIAALIG